MESPKRVLVRLEGLDAGKLPAFLLNTVGVRRDGILAVDVPRYPRVSDVKIALARRLGIPASEQVLRGPLPQTTLLSLGWVHLHKLGILPGLDTHGGKDKVPHKGLKRGARHPGACHPGELFSSTTPLAARLDQDGSVVSDILQLSTEKPIAEYLPGGAVYMKRMRRRQQRWMFLRLILLLLIIAVMFYGLWLVPGYEMPSYSNIAPVFNATLNGALNSSTSAAISNGSVEYDIGTPALQDDLMGAKPTRRDEL